jgi:hypothetical protein
MLLSLKFDKAFGITLGFYCLINLQSFRLLTDEFT